MSSSDRLRSWAGNVPCCLLLCASALFAGAAFGEEKAEVRERALLLYDEGRYVEALPLLAHLDAEGKSDGPLLYRLYFCQRRANDPQARATLERARLQLESEVSSSPDLEAPFYLANAHRNVGRVSDARQVASAATARVESGELPLPTSGVESFRLGKLYADQEKTTEAEEWYGKAVELLTAEGAPGAKPYVNWAASYLAEQAMARQDTEAAVRWYTVLSESGEVLPADLDRLATLSCRVGRYADAVRSWKEVERQIPAEANRARYCWRLAAMAEQLGALPTTAPDERPWSELSREELDALMKEQARVVRDAVKLGHAWKAIPEAELKPLLKQQRSSVRRAIKKGQAWEEVPEDEAPQLTEKLGAAILAGAAADNPWSKLPEEESARLLGELATTIRAAAKERTPPNRLAATRRGALQARIDAARPAFVAAALEFAMRGHSIREAAFFGGFAPLIFRAQEWRLPPEE